MDSILDYFTSVAQIAIETQIENFLYKKLCDKENAKLVLDKYIKSFNGKTQIVKLEKEQKKRGFIENKNSKDVKCDVCKGEIDNDNDNDNDNVATICKYCNKSYHNACIKYTESNSDSDRNLCPYCNKPFKVEYKCPNILVHSNILKQFDEVRVSQKTWFNITKPNEYSAPLGGRTRRKNKQHKWTRNRKKTKGKRAKSNKKRVQKKKPTKTRKYRSFILLRGGGYGPIEEGKDYWDKKKTPLYDEAMDETERDKRHNNIVNRNNIDNVTETDAETKKRIAKNLENLERLKEIKNHHLKKERYNEKGELINDNNQVIEDNSGVKPLPNIRTQISHLKDSFEKRRNAAMHKDTIPEQLFAKNKLSKTKDDTANDNTANAVPSNSSSGCCQRTPYNDFIQLISLIFNLSTEFIKEFFGLGEQKKGEKSEGSDAPKQNDILDKIMEILVSSIKLTLPDALGRAFKIHMTKLYMSKSNQNSMKEEIKSQTIKRIQATYLASNIKDLKQKASIIGKSKNFSLVNNK